MAEDPSSTTPETDDASKAETIRITLPPKQEQPVAKRETVRINLPGRPVPPAGVMPKKETTKLTGAAPTVIESAAPTAPVAPPAPSVPPPPGLPKAPSGAPMPPPPRPTNMPSAPGAPPAPKSPMPAPPKPIAPPSAPGSAAAPAPPLKPLGTSAAPPKPPTAPAKPTAPLKPAPAAASGAAAPAPILQKGAAPKKETARITLPAEGAAKPAMPKATIKMGQTQPLTQRPQATVIGAAPSVMQAPVMAAAPASDGTANALSIVAFVLSLAALAAVLMVYNVVKV